MGNPDSDSHSRNNESTIDENLDKEPLPRESLVSKAVVFLSDNKLQNQDPHHLRSFLIKKGLTENEVSIAFQRAEVVKNQSLTAEFSRTPIRTQHLAPPPPPASVRSIWPAVHNVITTITSIGGMIYALYWLWKTYISPWLFGRKPKKKPVEASLADLEAAVDNCVTDIRTIRSSLETLADQKAADLTQGVVITRIQEVKSEIGSLKTLMLSRNQFPATPTPLGTGPMSIPSWQMGVEDAPHREMEEESSGSPANTNGSDSSLEIVKEIIPLDN